MSLLWICHNTNQAQQMVGESPILYQLLRRKALSYVTKCVKTEVECMAVCYVHRKEAIVTAALPFPERNEIDF